MNTVAIVGRPNVGKSTLFNRLTGQRLSIVDDQSGVTRDRLYGTGEWGGHEFNVIDTGGFVLHSNDVFEKAIREQVEIAINEADAVIFVVDATTGITDLDQQMANILRRGNKEPILMVNKADNNARLLMGSEFYGMGFKDTFMVSAMTGSGTGELLDYLIESLDWEQDEDSEEDLPKIAILGQPNVGKSSLLNALTGQQRNIVTNIAGTTRDSIHTRYNYFNKDFLLIDTAGIRKKAKVHENLEFYSVIRAIKALDECDVAVLVIDATMGIEAQDLKIYGMAAKKKKGLVVCINKWDLIDKETNTARDMEIAIKRKLEPFSDVPIIFISALEKTRIFKAMETALDVHKRRTTKIPTSELNEVAMEWIERYPPPAVKGKWVKVKYVTQLPTYYPSFAFFCNFPKYVREPYRNYIENKLREHYNYSGVPVSVYFREK